MILVLEQGKIVARGTHEELIHMDGIYKETWNIQSNEDSEPSSKEHFLSQ